MSTVVQRRLPVGAEPGSVGVHFRVWAPRRSRVEIVIEGLPSIALASEQNGYFSGIVDFARTGMRYRYRLDEGGQFPDPVSRFQPEGPHGPSQIEDSTSYRWNDSAWQGARIEGQVIYE